MSDENNKPIETAALETEAAPEDGSGGQTNAAPKASKAADDKDAIMMLTLTMLRDQVADLKKAADKKSEEKKDTAWYTALVGILGVPALIIVMVMNFSEWRLKPYTVE